MKYCSRMGRFYLLPELQNIDDSHYISLRSFEYHHWLCRIPFKSDKNNLCVQYTEAKRKLHAILYKHCCTSMDFCKDVLNPVQPATKHLWSVRGTLPPTVLRMITQISNEALQGVWRAAHGPSSVTQPSYRDKWGIVEGHQALMSWEGLKVIRLSAFTSDYKIYQSSVCLEVSLIELGLLCRQNCVMRLEFCDHLLRNRIHGLRSEPFFDWAVGKTFNRRNGLAMCPSYIII